MKKYFSITELFLDPENGLDGVGAISIVSDPAIEEEYFAFSKENKIQLKEISKDERILMGAVLKPQQMIFRKFQDGSVGYVYFSAETIKETSKLFMQNGNQKNASLEHLVDLDGITVVESWIKVDDVHDKSVKFGAKYPNGTWIISMFVESEELWNDIVKSGMTTGFSIEGKYSMGNPNLSKDEQTVSKIKELLENIN